MKRSDSWHAVYVLLNDREFFPASLRSIYPHVSGVTVVTSWDRDRWDRPVPPDTPIDDLLDRSLDPDRKVNVLVSTDVSEARLRNRAMSFARLPRGARRFVGTDAARSHLVDPDIFWIVDADEVYTDDDVRRLKHFVAANPAKSYFVYAHSYFKSWNHQVDEAGPYLAVLRAGQWFGELRHRRATPWLRLWRRLAVDGWISQTRAYRAFGARFVPRDVATFHHGNYVGDRKRIETKLASSGHRTADDERWLRDVWDTWTLESRDFHPHVPPSFPSARYVETDRLPPAIREHDWPVGWIER